VLRKEKDTLYKVYTGNTQNVFSRCVPKLHFACFTNEKYVDVLCVSGLWRLYYDVVCCVDHYERVLSDINVCLLERCEVKYKLNVKCRACIGISVLCHIFLSYAYVRKHVSTVFDCVKPLSSKKP
jgi:hypothetical protein